MSDYNDSLKRMTKIMSDSLLCTSQFHKTVTSSTAFATTQSVAKIMEPYRNLCENFKTAYSDSIAKTIGSCLSQQLAKSLSDSIHKSFSDSLKRNPAFNELSSTLNAITPELIFTSLSHTYDFPKDLGGISEKDNDDFIVIDNAVSTAYDIPCTVAVPINEHKRKISTSDFCAIISLIIAIISGIIIPLYLQSKPSETEVIELQLLQSQNELLQQLLHNADISSSSEIEAINELKQSVEEQSKQLSQCQETLDKFDEALDNHETVENIDTAKKPIQ